MNVSVRSHISAGLAAATGTVIVIAPVEVQTPAQAVAPPVALIAQVQPLQLPVPAALNLPSQLPALIAQKVSFNTCVAVDFIVTGAELIDQQTRSHSGSSTTSTTGHRYWSRWDGRSSDSSTSKWSQATTWWLRQGIGELPDSVPRQPGFPAAAGHLDTRPSDTGGERRCGRHHQRSGERCHRPCRAVDAQCAFRTDTVTADLAHRDTCAAEKYLHPSP